MLLVACVSVLFSEPKIPQPPRYSSLPARPNPFQCSSASRKFLNLLLCHASYGTYWCFSALQRAENSSTLRRSPRSGSAASVSVLFSEPKIPQLELLDYCKPAYPSFSALQRAENSSTLNEADMSAGGFRFQCSSASRKFLNRREDLGAAHQRSFQCSSASRKFLNSAGVETVYLATQVSVLFSEPKIPQFVAIFRSFAVVDGFSALQRAENSSIGRLRRARPGGVEVSVLFSEPKIPQCAKRLRRC